MAAVHLVLRSIRLINQDTL